MAKPAESSETRRGDPVFGGHVKTMREAKGLTQQQLGDAIGIGKAMVSGMETGRYMPSIAVLRKLAEAFDCTIDELFDPQPERLPKTAAGKTVRSPATNVPVIGFAIANPDEDGYFDDMGFPPGSGMEYVPWPTRDRQAFALRVRGDSMAPRIRAGEIVIVEPGSEPHPGDDVLAKTKSGRKMVKRLLFKRGTEVTLGSINDAYKSVTIALEDIESLHLVSAIVQGSMAKERAE